SYGLSRSKDLTRGSPGLGRILKPVLRLKSRLLFGQRLTESCQLVCPCPFTPTLSKNSPSQKMEQRVPAKLLATAGFCTNHCMTGSGLVNPGLTTIVPWYCGEFFGSS